jgi:hypothetical protein
MSPFLPTVVALAAFVLASAAAGALAQEVHKCTQDGHVTYQAKPCAGTDKVLPISGGPDEEQVEAARQRAESQKARAAADPSKGASGAITSRSTTRIHPDLRP